MYNIHVSKQTVADTFLDALQILPHSIVLNCLYCDFLAEQGHRLTNPNDRLPEARKRFRELID
eukprot:gene16451-biopygen17185